MTESNNKRLMQTADQTNDQTTGEVTALKPDPDNPNVIGVDIDGEHVAAVSLAVVDRLELSVGMPATHELRRAIGDAVVRAEVRTVALDLLGARPYSCKELEERLGRRSYPDDAIKAIVGEFVEDGWLDDAAYAGILIAEQQRKGIAGPARLEQVLRKRGIEPGVVEQKIAEFLASTDAESEAFEAGQKKMESFGNMEPAAALRRTAGWLARRGIDEHILESVMERLADECATRTEDDPTLGNIDDDLIDPAQPEPWE